jgi:hypothetical protein
MPKTPSLGIRVLPETKDALERAARDDTRSVSSLVDKILVEWLRSNGFLQSNAEPREYAKPAAAANKKR